jgi:ubiquinone/menaquinone biosynthesis C-methylase UbiE
MRLNAYDRVAKIYDRLAKLVFGSRIVEAQEHFIPRIKPGSKILILGGGSGLILPLLFRINPSAEVSFIDASKGMLDLAKKKTFSTSVNFIHGTEENIPELIYDCVITNFYLDLFTELQLKEVMQKLARRTHSESQWIVTEFVSEKTWHRAFLKVMYIFFSITTGLDTKELPDWRRALKQHGFEAESDLHFYNGFILTSLYKRKLD